MNPKVDFFFRDAKKWQQELELLRQIVLDCQLDESLKWGVPCYTFQGRNIVLIHAFKEYCALLFFKGALLKDKAEILIQQTERVQAARQIRFRNLQDVQGIESSLRGYIFEAVEVEESGAKVELKKTDQYEIPEEFEKRLEADPSLKAAFASLTPGRQRAYLLHFAAPKQAKTRESRVEKSIPQILNGIGLND